MIGAKEVMETGVAPPRTQSYQAIVLRALTIISPLILLGWGEEGTEVTIKNI